MLSHKRDVMSQFFYFCRLEITSWQSFMCTEPLIRHFPHFFPRNLIRFYETIIRFYEILIRFYEILIRFYEILIRNYEIIIRFYEILFRN
jgi:hypothetical protein